MTRNRRKRYCSNSCRVQDCNHRKTRGDQSRAVVKANDNALEGVAVAAQVEEKPQAKGMTMAGVGESAVGTAGVLLLKDQLFDKKYRQQVEQQLALLVHQHARMAQDIALIKKNLGVGSGMGW